MGSMDHLRSPTLLYVRLSLRSSLPRKHDLTTYFHSFIHGAATFFFFMSIPWDFVAMDSMYRRCTGRANFTANDERNPLLYGR